MIVTFTTTERAVVAIELRNWFERDITITPIRAGRFVRVSLELDTALKLRRVAVARSPGGASEDTGSEKRAILSLRRRLDKVLAGIP